MAEVAALPEPNAVIRLAMAALREAPSGLAQHAIDAALGWSALFVPTSAHGGGDAIVHNKETGARTAVAFTQELPSQEWGGYQDLVFRRHPAMRVVWRALGTDFEGILLDPGEGNAGVLLPRAGLREVVAGRPRLEIQEGDNLALRLAVDALRSDPTPLARDALGEALANAGALVPAIAGEGHQVSPPYVLRSEPGSDGSGEKVLYAFTDREALSKGPAWATEGAIILAGRSLLDVLIDDRYSSLELNTNESGALVISRTAFVELGERLG